MISEELRSRLAAEALCSVGQGIRWHALLDRGGQENSSGKRLTLAFMGGSVTQGYANLAIHDGAYPALVTEDLRAMGYDAQCCLCAEAGMATMNGNLLADEWVLAKKPDVVFLEYAINETTLRPSVIAFESLLRKLLTAPEPPVVCLLLLRSMQGYSCEPFMVPIAQHYGLPYISLNQAIAPAMERGDLKWEDYGDEESHPNADGHRLLADMVLHLLDQAAQAEETPPVPLPDPWLEAPFVNLRFLHPAADAAGTETACAVVPRTHNPYYPAAWKLCPGSGPLKLETGCRALLVFYETHRLPEYGSCRIAVDGEPMKQPLIHSNSLYGWGNAKYVIAVSAAQSGAHTLLLEPEEETVYILGFGICE